MAVASQQLFGGSSGVAVFDDYYSVGVSKKWDVPRPASLESMIPRNSTIPHNSGMNVHPSTVSGMGRPWSAMERQGLFWSTIRDIQHGDPFAAVSRVASCLVELFKEENKKSVEKTVEVENLSTLR